MRRLTLVLTFLAAWTAQASPIIREPGAVYLSDFGLKPLRLKLLEPAPCYFDVAQTRFGGTLRFPQTIQMEAVAADGSLRIRGNAQQGGVAAWLSPRFVEPLPPDFVANLRKAEDRRVQVEALIAANEVAIGMTTDEVGRSLGKPQKRTNRADANGTQQLWEYVRYQLIPQTTFVPAANQTVITIQPGEKLPAGTLIQNSPGLIASTIYVKVPIGKLIVTFRDGIVTELDQSERSRRTGEVSVVIPPLTLY